MDLYITYAIYGSLIFFAAAAVSALFLPKQNTVAQTLLCMGGILGLAGVSLFAAMHTKEETLVFMRKDFMLTLPGAGLPGCRTRRAVRLRSALRCRTALPRRGTAS